MNNFNKHGEANKNVILLSSRLPFSRNIYTIGPYANRVSFASQQRRAFNLPWAIHQNIIDSGDEKGLNGKSIGVVGAGLAGRTASLVFSLYDCRVTLYEKSDDDFAEQSKANHRDIHPTINFWPFVTIEASTQFPILNWYEANCPDVIAQFSNEWDRLNLYDDGSSRVLLRRMHQVISAEEGTDGKIKLKIDETVLATDDDGKKQKKSIKQSPARHDIVAFSTGVGKEDEQKYEPGYWNNKDDHLEESIQDAVDRHKEGQEHPIQNVLISGTGDGGLIEVARAFFSTKVANSLPRLAQKMLSDTALTLQIREAEHRARERFHDCVLHLANSKGDAHAKRRFDDIYQEICMELEDAYHRVATLESVEEFQAEISSLARLPTDRLYLLGKNKSPYEPKSAPFHKIILSIMRDKITYLRVPEKQIEIRRIYPEEYSAYVKFDYFDDAGLEQTKMLDRCFVLRRHGATNPLATIFRDQDNELSFLRNAQAFYSEYDYLPQSEADKISDSFRIPRLGKSEEWAVHMLSEVEEYFRGHYFVEVVPHEYTGKGPISDNIRGGARYRLKRVPMSELAVEFQRQAGMTEELVPKMIFGVEVTSGPNVDRLAVLDHSGF